MTNEDFFASVTKIAKEKRGWSIYTLQKNCDENVIRKSTFFSMFQKKSTPKLEYIVEMGKALGVPVAEFFEGNHNEKYLSPLEIEILQTFEGYDEDAIRRTLLIAQGVLLGNDSKK